MPFGRRPPIRMAMTTPPTHKKAADAKPQTQAPLLTASAWTELARRAVVLVLFVFAADALFGYERPGIAAAAALLAIAAYWIIPRPALPAKALHHERLPSVWMPDLLGVLLATTFLSLPLIIAAREDWLGGPWMFMLFMWPPGLIALAIFWIAARYQCFWALISEDALAINTMRGMTVLPFASIVRVAPGETRPPRWLGPLLVLFGGWRGLGIALLHADRPSHWLSIERTDGTALRLPADAFPDARKIIKALDRAGVPLATELTGRPERVREAGLNVEGRADGGGV
jgi:hypothetical protein